MADGTVDAHGVHGGLAHLIPAQGDLPLAAAQALRQQAAGQQLAGHGAPAVVLAGDVVDAAAALLIHHTHGMGHGIRVQRADVVPKKFHVSLSSR